ncbi:MAG TPA: DUF2339 domain-containing protein [Xanthobacteraceae bacterium]
MFEVLIGLVVLAFPVLAIAALVVAVGTRDRVRDIDRRIVALERRMAQAPAASAPAPRPAIEPPQPVAPTTAEAPVRPAAPAAPPVTPTPAPAAPPTPSRAAGPAAPAGGPRAPAISFEERFGTRWVVWVGGLALALGGFFLVRYSIEQDLIGPGVKIFLAGLLAAALIAGGEWSRRQERFSGIVGLPTAHIPSILTAAGTAVAYATVYAAYALYGFVDAPLAFVLLAVVALATLAAALLHGPALAALGLVGAEVTPILVSTNHPNYWALYVYLAVVTASSFALARMRLWRWLAVTAVVFGVLWMFPGIDDTRVASLVPHAFHAVAGFGLAALLIVAGLFYGPPGEPDTIDEVSSGALVAYVFAAAALVIAWHHDTFALVVLSALVVATVAIAWRSDAAAAALPIVAGLAVLVVISWAVQPVVERLVLPGGPVSGAIEDPARAFTGVHLALGAFFALLFGATGFLAQGRSQRPLIPMLWAASSALAPVAILVALYYRVAGWERSIPFAGLALVLAALFCIATETLARRTPRPGSAAAQAIYASGAVAALALAMTFALDKGWLTIALAMMVPGIAWIAAQRPLPMLRWLAAVLVWLVAARIAWEPRIVGDDVGATPIFNWLLYGYGVPALAFWVGGHQLRQRADDVPARTVDAAAILFTVLLGFLEIRHYANDGDVYAHNSSLAELALEVSAGLAMAIGLERLRGRTRNVVHDAGAVVVALLCLVGIVVGLCFAENPLVTDEPVGGAFFNMILLGYGLPAVLAITLALVARSTRPMPYRATAAVVSVGLALLYLSLQVTRLYHGPVLTEGTLTDAEQYTYSAVWLCFGVVLLLAGIALGSKPVRLASAAVVLLTVAKVFLLDMSDLAGVWRALSFIGLGLVLVGIGTLYQRLLFPRRAPAAP